MWASARVLAPGESLRHFGLLITCDDAGGAVRGLRVRVGGSAIENGTIRAERARARPWSARLAPWEAGAWEHTLSCAGDTLGCVLRAARVVPPACPVVGRPRVALAHAVWVEIDGRAVREGHGELTVGVSCIDGGVEVETRAEIEVRGSREHDVVSAYAAWSGSLGERARQVLAVLDATARVVAGFPRGARVASVCGVALDRVHLRDACAVWGRDGLVGDPRFEALCVRMRSDALERLTLSTPGVRSADETLEAVVSQRTRFSSGPVELAISVGRALPGPDESALERVMASLGDIVAGAGANYGFVATHAWVPSIIERTPWEPETLARSLADILERGRVTESAAFRIVRA